MKKYFHFLIYRLLFGILTGVLIFGTIFTYLKDKYNTAINQGIENLTKQYEMMILYHYQHKVDNLYINIMSNFYQADYIPAGSFGHHKHIRKIFYFPD